MVSAPHGSRGWDRTTVDGFKVRCPAARRPGNGRCPAWACCYLASFEPRLRPAYAPPDPQKCPVGPLDICSAHTLFQTVSWRMRREHRQTPLKSVNTHQDWLTASEATRAARGSRATLYRYRSIGVGPRYTQLSARRLVPCAWLADWLLAQDAD